MARHPFVRQNDQSDCGAATLAMLALYHGLPMGLEQMRELTGTDRVGTHLLALLEAVEEGDHEQLMRRDGRYAALWKASNYRPAAETELEPASANGNGKPRNKHSYVC